MIFDREIIISNGSAYDPVLIKAFADRKDTFSVEHLEAVITFTILKEGKDRVRKGWTVKHEDREFSITGITEHDKSYIKLHCVEI